jgi:ATP-dependent DNA ligase
LSSEENPIEGVPHIEAEINTLNSRDFEFDGELYWHGQPHEKIHSIVSRGKENIHPDYINMKYYVFDLVLAAPQTLRLEAIPKLLSGMQHIYIVPVYTANTLDDVLRYYDLCIANGYEGFICRNKSNYYAPKRSIYMMKFKPKKDDLYRIAGYREEFTGAKYYGDPDAGIPKGCLGALICNSEIDDKRNLGEVEPKRSLPDGFFGVGTGFTEQQRAILWDERDKLVGKLAKVKYQHITSASRVPRFPVFVEIIDIDQQLKILRGDI